MPEPNALQDLADQLNPYLAGTDATAVHTDVSGEIAALTAKVLPVLADNVLIEDSADSDSKARATVGGVFQTVGWIANLADKATPIAADSIVVNDSEDSDAPKEVTLGSLPISQAQVASTAVQVVADDPAAILNTTGSIQLAGTTAATKVIATTSSYAGQKVNFLLLAASGGEYTLALDVGTLTLDAASESAVVQRNAGNTAWIAVGLSGATIV